MIYENYSNILLKKQKLFKKSVYSGETVLRDP